MFLVSVIKQSRLFVISHNIGQNFTFIDAIIDNSTLAKEKRKTLLKKKSKKKMCKHVP
jgi:hypothetical protein